MIAQNRPRRILLLGYYGFGNAGDEAVLAGLVKSLIQESKSADTPVEIAALSITPAATARDHRIKAFHRYRSFDLIKALFWCDLLAAGGGSLLQDVTSAHSIFYYLGVVRLAQILGKRTMFIAQGIGPLDLYRSKKLTAFVARNCDAITVRDPGSAELLKTIGVDHPSIQVAADPALILAPEQQIDPSSSKNVFISLRPWNGNDELVETLTASINDAKLDIDQLIPIACSSEDTDILALLKNSLKQTGLALPDAGVLTYSQIIDEVNGSPLMIGMRLHALILATACGVPCVALSYDPKVRAFMETTGQEDAVYDIRTSDPAKLTAIIQRVWQSRSQIQQTLADKLPHLCSAASSNAALALSLVKDL